MPSRHISPTTRVATSASEWSSFRSLALAATFWGVLLVAAVAPLALSAQAPNARLSGPRIGYVYPAGGQQGTTFTIVVGGQFLEGVAEAQFFGSGITAHPIAYQHPSTQKDDEIYKAELEKLQKKQRLARTAKPGAPKSDWTGDDEKRAGELRALLAYRMNRQTAPAICEAVTLNVTVSPDAAPGEREIRLRNANGLSNPLVFLVGQLPEFSEPAAHPNTVAPGGRDASNPTPLKTSPERTVTLPAVVNGQVLPGEVDRIRFFATKGRKLVIAVSARALIPYLADAVPGWFQPTLALYDASGRELAYDDDFRFNPDPVLFHEIRADGEYVIAIKDSIYRGRQDFVYRIAVGELPFITGLFPLGGRAGEKTSVEIKGWNLPSANAMMDGTGEQPGQLQLTLQRNGVISNPVAFAIDAEPACAEHEPNNNSDRAQKLTVPVIVDGRIASAGDRDVFSFEGRAGEEIIVEVVARRLNSPLDSILQVTDARGAQLAANDDHEDRGSGLTTHHADSRLAVKLPADGTYCIHLADAQRQGGPEYVYRLRIGPPQPGFELRVAPSSLNVRGGTNAPVTVYAVRKDGFAGEIALSVEDSSRAFSLGGARIPAGQDQVRLTLATPAASHAQTYPVNFVGRAMIGGQIVAHNAVPAEDMMQAFAYRHLVPAKEMKVQVIGRGVVPKTAFSLDDKVPLKIPAGGTATFHVSAQVGKLFENLRVELGEPPDGLSIQSVSERSGAFKIVFAADAAKMKPGKQGNLILLATGERAAGPDKKADQAKKNAARRVLLSPFPAIPYEIVAP